jgi:hypothetical protein
LRIALSWRLRVALFTRKIPFLNQKDREGEPQTVQLVRQGEADKEVFDLGAE